MTFLGFERVENESIIEERFQTSIQQNALFGDGHIVLGRFSPFKLLHNFCITLIISPFSSVRWSGFSCLIWGSGLHLPLWSYKWLHSKIFSRTSIKGKLFNILFSSCSKKHRLGTCSATCRLQADIEVKLTTYTTATSISLASTSAKTIKLRRTMATTTTVQSICPPREPIGWDRAWRQNTEPLSLSSRWSSLPS